MKGIFLILLFTILFTSGCAKINDNSLSDAYGDKLTFNDRLPNYDIKESEINEWWLSFQDNNLNKIVEEIRKENRELKSYKAAYEIALLNSKLIKIDNGFQNDMGLSSAKSKKLEKGSESSNSTSANISSSYMLDFFGKLELLEKISDIEVDITSQELRALEIISVSNGIELYLDVQVINNKLELYHSKIDLISRMKDITSAGVKYGSRLPIEVDKIDHDISINEAKILELGLMKKEAINNLKQLMGDASTDPLRMSNGSFFYRELPTFELSNDVSLLVFRPDVIQAEMRLAQKIHNDEIKAVSFYPDISLQVTASSSGKYFSDILTNPIGTLGASITFPFLNWSTLKTEQEVSKKELYRAALDFEDVVQVALNQINQSYLNAKNSEYQNKLYEDELMLKENEVSIYKNQVYFGYKTNLELINAKLDVVETKNAQLQQLAAHIENIISFCNATATEGCS